MFDSPAAIRQTPRHSFGEKAPSSTDFQIGYFEKRCTKKQLTKSMYESYKEAVSITIWCSTTQDGVVLPENTSRKRKSSEEESQTSTTSKCDAQENEVDRVFQELHSIHKYTFTGPQCRVWSRMIVNKVHDSTDEPPNIPIITGEPSGVNWRNLSVLVHFLKPSLELPQLCQSIHCMIVARAHCLLHQLPPNTQAVRHWLK